jgi:hypothetical protein
LISAARLGRGEKWNSPPPSVTRQGYAGETMAL